MWKVMKKTREGKGRLKAGDEGTRKWPGEAITEPMSGGKTQTGHITRREKERSRRETRCELDHSAGEPQKRPSNREESQTESLQEGIPKKREHVLKRRRCRVVVPLSGGWCKANGGKGDGMAEPCQ